MDNKLILPCNLEEGYLAYKQDIDTAVQRVLASGWYVGGQEVESFEEEYASWNKSENCVACGSGTDALQLALRTFEVGPGDLVLTVSHTAVATVAAVEMTGATPVLFDSTAASYTMNLDDLEQWFADNKELKNKVKAIIPVHLFGHPVDMPRVMKLAAQEGVKVIEDCAQAHGAMIDNQMIGTFGHAAAFSFYPTKNLGASGDAGGVIFKSNDDANRAKAIREYGWTKRYISEFTGINTRLDPLQAAILKVKLQGLKSDNEARRKLAATYNKELAETGLQLPQVADGCYHVYHQYVVRTNHETREYLQQELRKRNILTLVHYPEPVHTQPAYAGRITTVGDMAECELAAKEILSLPMYPQLSNELQMTIISAIKEILGSKNG